jgi:hypothetical protein
VEQASKLEAVWQQLGSDRVIGAWYALEAAVSKHPVVMANSTGVSVWQQWIGKGVVPEQR